MRNDPNSRMDNGGKVAGSSELPTGEGQYGQMVRGYANAPSVSPRPPKRPLPDDLADAREHIYSTGTDHLTDATMKKPASEPNMKPIPRGYIHAEPNFQPSTRDTTGGRISRRKV